MVVITTWSNIHIIHVISHIRNMVVITTAADLMVVTTTTADVIVVTTTTYHYMLSAPWS